METILLKYLYWTYVEIWKWPYAWNKWTIDKLSRKEVIVRRDGHLFVDRTTSYFFDIKLDDWSIAENVHFSDFDTEQEIRDRENGCLNIYQISWTHYNEHIF